jgi:parvulin-like peptidyl-prolyl isomerase
VSPQGKRTRPQRPRPAAEPARGRGSAAKRLGLIIFGALLIALFVIVAVAQGLGDPEVPSDAIAVVEDAPDGTVTKEDFDRGLVQTAARQGLKDVPETSDPQYQSLADAAESDLLLARWVAGEAQERGIETTEREIDDELEKVKQQQFGSEKEFQKFLDQSGFTVDEARERIELQLISDRIQSDVLPASPSVSDDEIQQFYDANIQQFEQPESRDVRVILTKDEADANAALAALQKDDSDQSFKQVAKKYSVDEATKSTGGLRQGVVEGQSEPTLDTQIFNAQPNTLVGPFKGDAGFYVIEVQKVTPAVTSPLDDVRQQISQTLAAQRQQEIAQSFQNDFQSKWISRTFCAEGYRIDRCANAEPPPPTCTEELIKTTGCDAPVPPRGVVEPGSQGVFGSTPPTVLPQGPQRPASAAAGGALPPGLSPVPGGAVPPGSVPPGTAPQTAPPPGG